MSQTPAAELFTVIIVSVQSCLSLDRSCWKIPSLPNHRPRQVAVKWPRLLESGLENKTHFVLDINKATAMTCSDFFLLLILFWNVNKVKALAERLPEGSLQPCGAAQHGPQDGAQAEVMTRLMVLTVMSNNAPSEMCCCQEQLGLLDWASGCRSY